MAGITESQIEADPALMQLKKALDDDPENEQRYFELAQYLENNGYEEAAISTYEQGLVKKPNNNVMLYELGRLQIKAGQETNGFQSFRKVMASVDAMSYVDKIGPYFLDVFSLSPIIYSSSDEAYASVDSSGNYLYYQNNQDGHWNIYRVALSGGTPEQITFETYNEENPSISPDGTILTLVSDKDDDRPVAYNQKLRDIYIYDIPTRKYINLTENFSNDFMPRFCNLGHEVVFVSERRVLRENAEFIEKYSNIFTMEPTGKFQIAITKGNYFDSNPVFSCTRRYVYFDSDRHGEMKNIFKIEIETKEMSSVLPDGNYNNFSPTISAEDDKLVYVSDRDGNYELYLYDFSSHLEERITSSDAEDLNPMFLPNTNKILFHSNRSGSYDIYMLDLDSENVAPTPYDILSQIDNKLIMLGGRVNSSSGPSLE